jgi:hypothetical protein
MRPAKIQPEIRRKGSLGGGALGRRVPEQAMELV